MQTHSREPIQEIKSLYWTHDSQPSLGLKISAFLLRQRECPKAISKGKFWVKQTPIQKCQMVERLKPKIPTFLNNWVGNVKTPLLLSVNEEKKLYFRKEHTLRKGLCHFKFKKQETKGVYA